MKRIIAFFLALALLPVFPVFAAQQPDRGEIIPQSAYDAVTADVWEDIEKLEDKEILAKRGKAAAAEDYARLADSVIELVTASETYVEGSLNRNGDFFTWETTQGVVCGYSPRLRAKMDAAETASGVETVSYAAKNGPGSADVAVFQPYMGIDDSFTTQYQEEGKSIAQTAGGSYTLYKGTSATIDAIANALESSAVVVFDSHGDTDYYTSYGDYTSRANTSYLCLQSGTGLTAADQKAVTGTYGTYYHAYFAGSNGSMKYYCVDGTAMANHMEKAAPNNMLWTAICLGMATDGLHKPLREKGVGVVYGYSQSVTFSGDYTWEELFWNEMKDGKTVSAAIAHMKNKAGQWDLCKEMYDYNNWTYDEYTYETIAEARRERTAFPIVVSAEDVYPGKGNVDGLQTVLSTWTLKQEEAPCSHANTRNEHRDATCTQDGYDRTVCADCGTVIAETVLPKTDHSYQETVVAPTCTVKGYTIHLCKNCGDSYMDSFVEATGHDYEVTVTAPTCTENGYTLHACKKCNYSYKDSSVPMLGHTYEDGVCIRCGAEDPNGQPPVHICPCEAYSDLDNTQWYHEGVDYVLANGLMNGVGGGRFEPDETLTRAMLVTILYRAEGSPSVAGLENPFEDVPDDWYTDAIIWAAGEGIVKGYSATEFAPQDPVTREQIAVILWRYSKEPAGTGDLTDFPDADRVNDYGTEALTWAVGEGLINGTLENGLTLLNPQGNATRAQIATILWRYLEK